MFRKHYSIIIPSIYANKLKIRTVMNEQKPEHFDSFYLAMICAI
ncbi:hypothetical protein X975_10784, partial [Stegodyphus mimosarum]